MDYGLNTEELNAKEEKDTKTQRKEEKCLEDELSNEIIGAAIEVHSSLGGPGLLESIYEAALYNELLLQGLRCKRQVPIPVIYKGITIRDHLLLDILVEDKVIIEVKATEKDHPIHEAQLLTYLRLSGARLGLLLNFGQKYMRDGIARVINGPLYFFLLCVLVSFSSFALHSSSFGA